MYTVYSLICLILFDPVKFNIEIYRKKLKFPYKNIKQTAFIFNIYFEVKHFKIPIPLKYLRKHGICGFIFYEFYRGIFFRCLNLPCASIKIIIICYLFSMQYLIIITLNDSTMLSNQQWIFSYLLCHCIIFTSFWICFVKIDKQ